MSQSISLHKFKILISLQGVQKLMQTFAFFYSDYSNFYITLWQEISVTKFPKSKNLRWQFKSIFRWFCRGVLPSSAPTSTPTPVEAEVSLILTRSSHPPTTLPPQPTHSFVKVYLKVLQTHFIKKLILQNVFFNFFQPVQNWF